MSDMFTDFKDDKHGDRARMSGPEPTVGQRVCVKTLGHDRIPCTYLGNERFKPEDAVPTPRGGGALVGVTSWEPWP